MKYYFLVTYLPEIKRDDKKIRLGFADLLGERDFIPARDWKEIERLQLGRDIFLLERLLSGKDVEVPYTLYDRQFWIDQIKAPSEAPPFLEGFLRERAAEKTFGPEEVNRLYALYYHHVIETTSNPFLREYFSFERLLRNVLAAVRARKKGLSPADHLLGNGDEILEQLGRSNAEDFGLGQELPWIERLTATTDPLGLEETQEQILWEYIDRRTANRYFDFEVVLAYLLKVQILERRLALSEEQGMEIVRQLEGE